MTGFYNANSCFYFYFLRSLRDSENTTYALQASMQSTTEKENLPQLQYLCKEVIHQNSLYLKSLPPTLKNDLIEYNQNQKKRKKIIK